MSHAEPRPAAPSPRSQATGLHLWLFQSRLNISKYANHSHRLQHKALCPLISDLLAKPNLDGLPTHGLPLLFPASSVPTFSHPPRGRQQALARTALSVPLWPVPLILLDSLRLPHPCGLATSSLSCRARRRDQSLLGPLPTTGHHLLGGRKHVSLVHCSAPGSYQTSGTLRALGKHGRAKRDGSCPQHALIQHTRREDR